MQFPPVTRKLRGTAKPTVITFAEAGGSNTWAPTYVETIRCVGELARFGMNTCGVIFHSDKLRSQQIMLNGKVL